MSVDARASDGSCRPPPRRSTATYAVGDEEQPTHPVSPYGMSKLAAERSCSRTCTRRLPGRHPALLLHLRAPPATRHGLPHLHRGPARRTSRSPCSVTVTSRDPTPSSATAWRDDRRRRRGQVGEIYNIGGGVPLELRDEAIDLIADRLDVRPAIVRESRTSPAISGRHRPTRPRRGPASTTDPPWRLRRASPLRSAGTWASPRAIGACTASSRTTPLSCWTDRCTPPHPPRRSAPARTNDM
jgi:nucleoside-diphosphate-sugar epimerase